MRDGRFRILNPEQCPHLRPAGLKKEMDTQWWERGAELQADDHMNPELIRGSKSCRHC
jgi:hypothetical protein